MTQMRYIFIFSILIVSLLILWYQFNYINSQKDWQHQGVQALEKKLRMEIKEKMEDFKKYLYNSKKHSLKYILIWTPPNHDPLMYLGKGQNTFIEKNCKVQSCFITTDKTYFENITHFDVVLFNGPEILNRRIPKLPPIRLPYQNYVFASIESSDYYPICDNKFDGFFNMSWTYRLDSDIFYGYIIVRNNFGEVIGPKKEINWLKIDEMKPVNKTIKEKLSSKKKLAAWLVSNCNAPSGRDHFVKKVQKKLKAMGTNMTVDVYGDCGGTPCKRADMPRCLEMIEKDYYFYFSFENSFADDYVTEKILHPLQHYTVPVVLGTANYTRFLPDGIYLNAKELGVDALAEKMVDITNDKEKYYEYFRWMNHYSFHYVEESPKTDFHCKFCEAINNDTLMKTTTIIQNFKEWWNPKKLRPGVPCPPIY